jgi:hypothetical protein
MLNSAKLIEDLISDLAEVLDIPSERYESAERSYKSVGEWFERPASQFANIRTRVYTQGSFRLGTVIRPATGEEHYDLDIVCEFSLDKAKITQKSLQAAVGQELGLYSRARQMEDLSPWNRCWTLNYADSAQFHMDVLPALPDEQSQRRIREQMKVSAEFVGTSVAITDRNDPYFASLTEEWPVSNPNGYATWFYERMKSAFAMRRRAIMLAEKKASISEIPEFRVKTPLQSVVQILKRHRDLRFEEEPEFRPTSIIITTLAAHAYQQEASSFGALQSILSRMSSFIEQRNGRYWIPNPTDPRENFADGWNAEPKKKDAFFDWLETVQADFKNAAESTDVASFLQSLAPRMGRRLVEAAVTQRNRPMLKQGSLMIGNTVKNAIQRILDAPHRKPIIWPTIREGRVWFESATAKRDGFRSLQLLSDGASVPIGHSLDFVCKTDVKPPFQVYWQVVNTGMAARAARDLTGQFQSGIIESSGLVRRERTKYPGTHSIECFVVKDGYCVAKSGPFIVNIAE